MLLFSRTECYTSAMFRLMTKEFAKWADKNQVAMRDLSAALDEIGQGLVDADLGGNLVKKRIPLQGRGKRGGARAILCGKQGDRIIFLHGFAKNEKSDLSQKELAAFRRLADVLVALETAQVARAIDRGIFIEVKP